MKSLLMFFLCFFFGATTTMAQGAGFSSSAEVNASTTDSSAIEKELEPDLDIGEDRYPEAQPLFVRPPGPDRGGTIKMQHPNAKKGLIKIDKDGSYYYQTLRAKKSKAGSIRVGSFEAPKIEGINSSVSFKSVYGLSRLNGAMFDYEWQPFTSFGRMGLQLGTGLATVIGKGVFKTARSNGATALEKYTMYIVPLTAFLIYRFEYVDQQLIVPFINGGVTYYGLAEFRDDGKRPNFAGAAAAGGGGGLHVSISRLSRETAFAMASEYGIAELWLTGEVRTMKGLKQEIDFTNTMVSVGLTADY